MQYAVHTDKNVIGSISAWFRTQSMCLYLRLIHNKAALTSGSWCYSYCTKQNTFLMWFLKVACYVNKRWCKDSGMMLLQSLTWSPFRPGGPSTPVRPGLPWRVKGQSNINWQYNVLCGYVKFTSNAKVCSDDQTKNTDLSSLFYSVLQFFLCTCNL